MNGHLQRHSALAMLGLANVVVWVQPLMLASAFSTRTTLSSRPRAFNLPTYVRRIGGRRVLSRSFATLSDECEFSLSPLLKREPREHRERREKIAEQRFLQGDRLTELREGIATMQERLRYSEAVDERERMMELTSAVESAETRDAELVYAKSLREMQVSRKKRLDDTTCMHYQEAKQARENIPHFNLDGLWVGRYGPHGYEMINITYSGDTLIATKVTGEDITSPLEKGEVAFTVDLSPLQTPAVVLEHVELRREAANECGVKHVERVGGFGRIFGSKSVNDRQWTEGQMILFGQHFSFAWVPLGYQVFFGRPTQSMILEMLREDYTVESFRADLNELFKEDTSSR